MFHTSMQYEWPSALWFFLRSLFFIGGRHLKHSEKEELRPPNYFSLIHNAVLRSTLSRTLWNCLIVPERCWFVSAIQFGWHIVHWNWISFIHYCHTKNQSLETFNFNTTVLITGWINLWSKVLYKICQLFQFLECSQTTHSWKMNFDFNLSKISWMEIFIYSVYDYVIYTKRH